VTAHYGIFAEVTPFSYLASTPHSASARTPLGGLAALVESMQQHRYSHIRVVHPYQGGTHGLLGHKIAAYDDYRSLLVVDVMGVFGVAKESDASLTPLLYLAWFPHAGVLVALDGSSNKTGQFFGCILHIFSILEIL
jgi:hypothetical protein